MRKDQLTGPAARVKAYHNIIRPSILRSIFFFLCPFGRVPEILICKRHDLCSSNQR